MPQFRVLGRSIRFTRTLPPLSPSLSSPFVPLLPPALTKMLFGSFFADHGQVHMCGNGDCGQVIHNGNGLYCSTVR